jgi:hypothetical protein
MTLFAEPGLRLQKARSGQYGADGAGVKLDVEGAQAGVIVPGTTAVVVGTVGIALVKLVGTFVSFLPSRLFLTTAPRVVHVRSMPTSGERKKFSAARTVVVVAPCNATDERYPLTDVVAVSDE